MALADGRRTALRLAARPRGLSTGELAARGIHTQVLSRLVAAGELERVARGLYRTPDHSPGEHHGLAIAAASVPRGTICLLSALHFHGIGTQLPHEVWIAIDRRARQPALDYPPLRVMRFSGEALTAGIDHPVIEGRKVSVYNVPKTLADCFKYRNKIGLDVALEALRDAWRGRRFRMEEIDRYAGICRVREVMRPYLEGLAA